MQCEVCGRRIAGNPYKAIIEGAKLLVCKECGQLGSASWEFKTPKPAKPGTKVRSPLKPESKLLSKQSQSPLEPTLELVKDFGMRIRQAREARGLSHEDLGRKLNEKVSLIKKLEGHKMIPNHKLAEKLQHALKIKLLVRAAEEKYPKKLLTTASSSKTITLGDLIKNSQKPEAAK
ncbi:MAG: multiprotein bridging factor aMBF1 [Candidatus Bathyarchaeia archaeon]